MDTYRDLTYPAGKKKTYFHKGTPMLVMAGGAVTDALTQAPGLWIDPENLIY